MIYLTGDTHGKFERIDAFCRKFGTKKEDVLIILGDAGINFGNPCADDQKKAIAIGGAYSIDKALRLKYGWGW